MQHRRSDRYGNKKESSPKMRIHSKQRETSLVKIQSESNAETRQQYVRLEEQVNRDINLMKKNTGKNLRETFNEIHT